MEGLMSEIENKNVDAKILEKAYREYAKDGVLTKAERITLEKMDSILKKADIVIDKSGLSAIIAQGGEIEKIKASSNVPVEQDWDKLSYYTKNANIDSKILIKAFDELSEHGLTDKEIEIIEKLDDLLAHSDITIGENCSDASVIEPNGWHVSQKTTSPSRGK
jgi:N12 class adenine-specific DNA methylase